MVNSLASESDALDRQPDNGGKRQDTETERTPLPWLQLSIVYLIQFAEPVTATVIFPFINQFVRETGITGGDEKKTGYFAGLIESSFFFAEAATVVLWAMASDRFGRRPILILGPLGLTIAMMGFGMSTKFWSLVVFRCLQGTFNGNIGVSKTVLGEMTDKTNIADAFAFIPLIWSVSSTLGPILGGLLSRPADQWPETLGKIAYLRSHPYFLPCFSAAMIAFPTFLGAVVGLRETLPAAILRQKQRQKKMYQQSETSSSTSLIADVDIPHYGSNDPFHRQEETIPSAEHLGPPSIRDILTRDVVITLINYAFMAFCDMCIQVLQPLMWSSSVENGGLGFTSHTIGLTMGIFGVVNAFVQIKFLARIIRRFGPRRVYIVGFSGLIVSFLCFLGQGYFVRRAGGADWRVWAFIVVQLCTETMSYGNYASMQIIITGVAPSRSALGTVNGVAQAVVCVTRSLAPSFASSLFAISLQRGWAGGNAVYYLLLAITACGVRLTVMVPKTLNLN